MGGTRLTWGTPNKENNIIDSSQVGFMCVPFSFSLMRNLIEVPVASFLCTVIGDYECQSHT